MKARTFEPLTLSLLGLLAVNTACNNPASSAPATVSKDATTFSVETVAAKTRPVDRFITLTGSLIPNQESEVAADAAGKVVATYLDRGRFVKKGEPLAKLDSQQAELSASAAQASLGLARTEQAQASKDCERAEFLFREKAISQAEYDRSKTACEARQWSIQAAETQAKMAEKMVRDAVIRAPFSGVVAERYLDVGEYVMPASRVALLVEINPLRLELTVPESASGSIKEGQEVRFRVTALPGEFTAKIRYLGPQVRRNSRDLVVEAIVENEGALKPGMFATAKVALSTAELPLVPRAAVRSESGTHRVFVLKDNRLVERVVQLGELLGEDYVIEQGVDAGEQVVSPVRADLFDGALVK